MPTDGRATPRPSKLSVRSDLQTRFGVGLRFLPSLLLVLTNCQVDVRSHALWNCTKAVMLRPFLNRCDYTSMSSFRTLAVSLCPFQSSGDRNLKAFLWIESASTVHCAPAGYSLPRVQFVIWIAATVSHILANRSCLIKQILCRLGLEQQREKLGHEALKS
jgi:hypothetical protein